MRGEGWMTPHKLMKWGLIVPLMLLPLVLREEREWWQHLVLLVGGYVVIVFGAISGWKLTDLAAKLGARVSTAVRAFVGMALCYAIFSLGWFAISPADRPHFLTWKVLPLAVAFGMLYAFPPSRWRRRPKQYKHQ